MGSGKTVISLTAIEELLRTDVLKRVLIIAPLKIADLVWSQECTKWEHLANLKIAVATGNEAARDAVVQSDCDVMVLNNENVKWFFKKYGKQKLFDGLLIDELSKYKDGGSNFKAMRHYLKSFKWRVGMTGTPVHENLESLFYQVMIVDCGESLGVNKSLFMREYFVPLDYNGYKWGIQSDKAGKKLISRINHLIHLVPGYKDSLPTKTEHKIEFDLPPQAVDVYRTLARDSVFENVEAVNEAVLSGKLSQVASGFLYNENGPTIQLHDMRLRTCVGIVNKINRPVIIVYEFTEDRERLDEAFIHGDCIKPGMDKAEIKRIFKRWNEGATQVLLIHPKSLGHGVQLQYGGADMIFYTPLWSNDLREQTIARIWRRGQTKSVNVYELVSRGTVDEIKLQRVKSKKEYDVLFKKHIQSV
jgi:SNF2 family DNA or RNA helicase